LEGHRLSISSRFASDFALRAARYGFPAMVEVLRDGGIHGRQVERRESRNDLSAIRALALPPIFRSIPVRRFYVAPVNESQSSPSDAYRLTTVGELRQAGFTAANRPTITLDPSRVPVSLRPLIPLAERWGIADDVIRDDVFRQAIASDLQHLVAVLREHDDALDEWLAGPEASVAPPSPEYVAFSAMRMGADFP
jgi:hypothetical protein